jgi:hypothetical protein
MCWRSWIIVASSLAMLGCRSERDRSPSQPAPPTTDAGSSVADAGAPAPTSLAADAGAPPRPLPLRPIGRNPIEGAVWRQAVAAFLEARRAELAAAGTIASHRIDDACTSDRCMKAVIVTERREDASGCEQGPLRLDLKERVDQPPEVALDVLPSVCCPRTCEGTPLSWMYELEEVLLRNDVTAFAQLIDAQDGLAISVIDGREATKVRRGGAALRAMPRWSHGSYDVECDAVFDSSEQATCHARVHGTHVTVVWERRGDRAVLLSTTIEESE